MSLFLQTNSKNHSEQSNKFLQSKSEEEFGFVALNNESEDEHTAFYYHKWTNFIVWGVLADFGILANRYGSMSKHRLNLHSIIMGLCVLPTVIAEILMIAIWNPPEFYGNLNLSSIHAPIGFTYLGLMILQSTGGVILKLCIESNNPQKYTKIMSIGHIYLGYSMYFLGKIQCGFGFYEVYSNVQGKGQGNLIMFWIVYGLLFFWRIIFEWLYQNGKLFEYFYSATQTSEKTGSIQDSLFVQYLIQNDQLNIEKEYNNKMWFIFNNSIVDLTGFVHPGGQYIWEKTKGREISRFIYGGQSLEDGNSRAYTHSDKVITLIQRQTIGYLNGNSIENTTQQQINKWTLINQYTISEKISLFGFKNSSKQIESQLTSLHQFGKYYQIKSSVNKKISVRQYTSVVSMAPENVQYRQKLINLIQVLNQIKSEDIEQINQQPRYLNELPLIIKKYESNLGFSQYIHTHKGEEYEIEGPYGPSLGLPNKGRVTIICGGTGILPFLDLLDFQLQSSIYQIVKKKLGQKMAEKLNPFECQFSNGLHITLIIAVADKSELIGQEIFKSLITLQNQLEEQSFKMILKIKEQIEGFTCVNERFDQSFMRQQLGQLSQYDKFYVCGPPVMNQTVPITLINLGVQEKNIHYV
ncbi:unnamed protein product [Paramecium primaurelia]|uniref:Cytochrome b561 domain-containing protein n=1 Tax=Paramecium primaurelia TaxID=5886 RepID=A0A8S1PWD8_PARPR|nr:unnamed protein product [Paramecium primaurelia]